ncbi:MAG: hypothetical protein RBS55_07005 [Bacteroidales bacterium]|jgi:hypothetical protein|nr:hypothetical protein [Bacteroidales bacterium]
MKKLVLSLAIIGFVAFGAIGIQNVVASTAQVEVANFDKDPKKDENKKAADNKDVKAETKTTEGASKSCASSCASTCTDKSETAKSCCAGEKSSCEKSCPDKK